MRKSVATEHPELHATAIDIGGKEDVRHVALELIAASNENEIAFRGGRRWVSRLTSIQATPGAPSRAAFRSDATYLITGGFGGLGLLTAEWLVRSGARHIALLGRRLPDGAADQIAKLHANGSHVRAVVADVSSQASLAHATAEIESAMPPIRGIFHAAGILDDNLVTNLTAERFSSVLRAKAGGAWNLHTIFADREIDLFVLFSSIAALIGSPGQANHAAANTYLDALAHYRRCLHLPALSVNWGPWGDVGKAAGHSAFMLQTRGLNSLSAETAFAALEHLLALGWAQGGVADFDFRSWSEYYPATRDDPYFSRYLKMCTRGNVPDAPVSRGDITRTIVRLAANILRHSEGALSQETPLREYGMDSLRVLELRNRIESEFNVRIPAAAMWRFPTARALASHVHDYLHGGMRQDTTISDVPPAINSIRERIAALEASLR